jgi:hypothetical protein
MNSSTFVETAIRIAKDYKSLYVMGCFGAPMNDKNKERYCNNRAYNSQPVRTVKIKSATADTFGFDCVCLIKGILWGWEGDESKTYGGAKYASNGVPDVNADGMIRLCKDVSTDFSKIIPGEVVWKSGHIGIYIGDGLAVEATPAWEDKVQITAVMNKGLKSGYEARSWTKHGKLPWVDYSDQAEEEPATKPSVTYQVYADGKWWGEITGYNTKDSNGYAGVFGKEISGLRVKLSEGEVTVRSHICGKPKNDWLSPVTDWNEGSNGYSGWKGRPTDCIAINGEKLKYRVHIKGGKWLPWVSGYDITNSKTGFAGIYGKTIDAVQIGVKD